MARRMEQDERTRWHHGTSREHVAISRRVSDGEYQCDDCDEVALTIGHDGRTVDLRCATCFLASLDRDRAARRLAAK